MDRQIVEKVVGGRMCQSHHCIDGEGRHIFVKTGGRDGMFEIEATNNRLLASLHFNVPSIVSYGNDELVMEYIEFDENKCITGLAKCLKKLHACISPQGRFGMDYNGFLGPHRMPNEWMGRWEIFFGTNRWQILMNQLLDDNPEFLTTWVIGMKVYSIMDKILCDPIIPSLLHGDMNYGNWGSRLNKIYLFDTSGCFYGDPLYDIIALTMWLNEEDTEKFIQEYGITFDPTSPICTLYRAYIYMVCFYARGIKKFKTKSVEEMLILLSRFPKYWIRLAPALPPNPILLVQNGSFNPPHRNHVRNLQLAMAHIKTLGDGGDSDNIHAIMAPGPNARIKAKCSNGFTLSQRYHMLKMVCDGIHIDLSQEYGTGLVENYMNIYGPNTKIFIVGGTDSCTYHLLHYPPTIPIIIIRRGLEPDPPLNDRLIILDNMNERVMSSTNIRNLSTHKQLIKYVEPAIITYLETLKLAKIKKNYFKHNTPTPLHSDIMDTKSNDAIISDA